MPKRTVEYRAWLLNRLSDPKVASSYLKGVLRDSPELFPKALRKVAEARGVALSKVARNAGVERESVYRMLSETGNPTWTSLRRVVKALGLQLTIDDDSREPPSKKHTPAPVGRTAKRRSSSQQIDGARI